MAITLDDLPDDLLIYAIAILSVPDILFLRQTCTRFNALTRLEIIWINAFKFNILSKDYPCPVDDTDFEQRTCHAYRLATRWLADSPLIPVSQTSFNGSPAQEIKFIPGCQNKQKCSEWSPKGELFVGVTLNADPESDVSVVVTLSRPQTIVLLHLDGNGSLRQIQDIDVGFRPVSMTGDIISFSDDVSKTLIYNWKTEERAYLEGGDMPNYHCNHVVFAPNTVVVVCINTFSVYAMPPLLRQINTAIMTNCFDWFDRTSATPTSLLIFSEMYRPQTLEPNLFQLCSLASVPPTLLFEGLSRHRVLSHVNMVLGKRGTVSPPVFPGSLNPTAQVRIRELCSNAPKNWTALNYDEELERIALGSRYGEVTITQL
ncbi:uncharacterized protein EV420DRAFT_1652216 [Desarmillaria tabescens]|uniref:F-box domain-containing protein n=1 Tax=Armillaria tabescens TaxID=1929756 RepID=A0AA39MKD7_ARMTA|nr:uncharacterized protein EV420DRAFT_1652216 [Desarmillaria tabescens]KAK0437088.1 hypothetical protein EV420DRAFT_1652216 [Desarmillaria tabescens]